MALDLLQNIKDLRPIGKNLMGLDVGSKTIGVALSDSSHSIATPLTTVKRTKFSQDIKALEKMKTVGVRMLLVLDDEGTLKGLITAHDILGEGVIEYVEKHRIKREELTVNEIMQPIMALHGLPLQEVLNSGIVGQIKADINRAEAQLQQLSTRLGDAHPQVQEA